MKKNTLIIIIVAVVIAGGAVAWAMSNNSKDSDNSAESTTNTNTTDGTSTSNGDTPTSDDNNAVATDEVEIENNAFSPANITVKKGTKVTWTNKDDVMHTATTEGSNPEQFDSGNLGKNDSFSFTFNTVGTYNYLCTPHPFMKGTITLTE